jgi:hypothetical protein
VPHDLRDQVVDFVRRWSEKTEIPAARLVGWASLARSKFFDWKSRYGKVNEHNGWIERAMRFLGKSTSVTVTMTFCCTLSTSAGSLIKRSLIWLTWTSPSWWTPMSTKAPKAVTLVTMPGNFMPGFKSSIFSTPT